jgi:hypothetical protein
MLHPDDRRAGVGPHLVEQRDDRRELVEAGDQAERDPGAVGGARRLLPGRARQIGRRTDDGRVS